jgi:hypothetical protein
MTLFPLGDKGFLTFSLRFPGNGNFFLLVMKGAGWYTFFNMAQQAPSGAPSYSGPGRILKK